MTIPTSADFISFACERLEAARRGEEGSYEALTFLLAHHLVLPTEIGLVFEEYEVLQAAHAARQGAAKTVRLQHALRYLRSDPFSSRLYAFREELDRLHDPTIFERLGTSREELAKLRRRAEERHMGRERFLAGFKERFERSLEPSHANGVGCDFDSLLIFFETQAIRPEEIGTTEAELRTRWQQARVTLARRLWASLSGEWTQGFNPAKPAHDLTLVMGLGVTSTDMGTTQPEIDTRLHQAFVFEAADRLARLRREPRLYLVTGLKQFCETWGVLPAEFRLEGTFEDLETSVRAKEDGEALRAIEQRLRRDCERYGVAHPEELSSGERVALQRRIWVLCVRQSLEMGDDPRVIEEVGDSLDCLEHAGRSLYGEAFPGLTPHRPGQLEEPADHLTHEEVGLTREAFVSRMRDALVVRLRTLIERSLTQDAMHDEEMGQGDSHPAYLLERLHDAVNAGLATYEELGATPSKLKRLAEYAYHLIRYNAL